MHQARWLVALLPLALSLQPPVLKARLEAQETRIRELRKRCEDVLPSEDEAALLLDGYYPALDRDEALDHFLLRFVDGVRAEDELRPNYAVFLHGLVAEEIRDDKRLREPAELSHRLLLGVIVRGA